MNLDDLIERIADRVVDRLKPAPKPKPARPAPPPRELIELEKIQRHFEFLREHGGIVAEGRYDRATEQIDWRRR
jgi:hypothetical protein